MVCICVLYLCLTRKKSTKLEQIRSTKDPINYAELGQDNWPEVSSYSDEEIQDEMAVTEKDGELSYSRKEGRAKESDNKLGEMASLPAKRKVAYLADGPPPVSGRALSAYGDTVSSQNVHVLGGEVVSRIAKLHVSVGYAPTAQRLEVTLIRAAEIPDVVVQCALFSSVAIHVALLPSKRHRFKSKSKSTKHSLSMNESFAFRGVPKEDLLDCQFRFRLYAQGPMRRAKVLGEAVINITDFDLEDIISTMWIEIPSVTDLGKVLKMQ